MNGTIHVYTHAYRDCGPLTARMRSIYNICIIIQHIPYENASTNVYNLISIVYIHIYNYIYTADTCVLSN